jgi:hypothetical protein
MASRIVTMADLKPALGALHAVSLLFAICAGSLGRSPQLTRSVFTRQSVSDAARALVEAEPPDEVTRAKRHALATANQKPVSKVARHRSLAVFQSVVSPICPSRPPQTYLIRISDESLAPGQHPKGICPPQSRPYPTLDRPGPSHLLSRKPNNSTRTPPFKMRARCQIGRQAPRQRAPTSPLHILSGSN